MEEKKQKVQELNLHCGDCPDCIMELCNRFCNYEEGKTALCCQPRLEDVKIKDNEKILDILIEAEKNEKSVKMACME